MGTACMDFRGFADKPDGGNVTYHLEMHEGDTHDLSPAIPHDAYVTALDAADSDDFNAFSYVMATEIPAWWAKWDSAEKHQFMASLAARNG